jgi:tRNA pseudouridine32 synthase/23S rRNA pseudouridine746 synthase
LRRHIWAKDQDNLSPIKNSARAVSHQASLGFGLFNMTRRHPTEHVKKKQKRVSTSKNTAQPASSRNIPKSKPDTPSSLPVFDYVPPEEQPEIIFSDDHIIVLNKPSGLLSVPGARPGHKDCLVSRAQENFPTARIVHRLDMDTSGLIVMALNADIHRTLSMQFEKRQVSKTYRALVSGHPIEDEGVVDLPLIADWPNRPKQKVDHDIGKRAETRYQVSERFVMQIGDDHLDVARVTLFPITGRSHQLRVHMLEIAHPILGDAFYAQGLALSASPRLCLHAAKLGFDHPFTQEPMQFSSERSF